MRRTRMKRKPPRPRPKGHVDEAYKAWVRLQMCRVAVALNTFAGCMGRIQPHHAGEHGLSQLPPDNTCIPLCLGDHDARHNLTGFFRGMSKEQRRAWEDEQIRITQNDYPGGAP